MNIETCSFQCTWYQVYICTPEKGVRLIGCVKCKTSMRVQCGEFREPADTEPIIEKYTTRFEQWEHKP